MELNGSDINKIINDVTKLSLNPANGLLSSPVVKSLSLNPINRVLSQPAFVNSLSLDPGNRFLPNPIAQSAFVNSLANTNTLTSGFNPFRVSLNVLPTNSLASLPMI